MRMMKIVGLVACALFFTCGAALWIYVATTQEDPNLRLAAFEISLLPVVVSVLLVQQTRRRSSSQQ